MGKSKNILFVDEDKTQLKALEKMISPMKNRWTINFASTAEEVTAQLQTRPFDIVATDFKMSGFEDDALLNEIKTRQPGAIRFIISESISSHNCLQFVNYAHQFITKPCSSAELIEKIKKSLRLKNVFLNERAAKAIASIEELPTMPDLYHKLDRELRKEDIMISDIGRLIGEDISMTAGILKLVNSPFFGLFSKVTTPEKAVTLLGLDTLKGLVLGMHLFNSSGAENIDFSLEDLGEHCQYTGLMARSIIKSEGGDRDLAENTFLAGFMHDIGKLVLSTSYAEEYKTILSIVREAGISIQEAEKDILGFTHAEVGAYLLAIWGFNEDVVEAVYCHHDLSNLGSTDISPAVAIHVANSFDHELRDRPTEQAPHLLDAIWLEQNGFSPKLVDWLKICAGQMENDVGIS
ncbi:response regulator [Maridesulfovibrio hydrothermalis]|uniref:Response regulator receiver modulated metal dependent phosphohydrolase n=1 Tax=Maridesulfovibrio hydrothermalis AM13 = DSM 14728 TaxID=1121451 RepID=L0R615_9BACT|nr:response regulator [Maridesulfovibrio hydrothermalis]CCO22133.1 Response regulator receiver modulated metal dependent phosphohydrolase [Maridesulfovibrio hydrothermalis AM13 = DSM 14728]